jgi:hypothetical protein
LKPPIGPNDGSTSQTNKSPGNPKVFNKQFKKLSDELKVPSSRGISSSSGVGFSIENAA